MTTKHVSLKTGSVSTEGDELYYEVRGAGQPLLMIPGGGGNGRVYSPVADILSEEFKVITYDRRGNSRSTGNHPQNFEVSQQSRDAVAVLHAAGETSAFVFGNSSGAVIALDIAKTQPQAVKAVVVHEPPTVRLQPHAKKWQRFFASVYGIAFSFGTLPAMLKFVLGVGLPIQPMVKAARRSENHKDKILELREQPENTSDFFVKQELLPVTNYLPDIEMIKKNGVKIFMAAGKVSLEKKRFYAQTAPILARLLDCELIVFPGHHVSFVDLPDEWAATLCSVLHRAEGVTR
ncbi:MAG TPA: alpha/beta hydrolase [Anaerolineales bacterium]|nr:alpha/beta hydrolase [Anaerolineales bacterium]